MRWPHFSAASLQMSMLPLLTPSLHPFAVVGDPSSWAWLVSQLDAVRAATKCAGVGGMAVVALRGCAYSHQVRWPAALRLRAKGPLPAAAVGVHSPQLAWLPHLSCGMIAVHAGVVARALWSSSSSRRDYLPQQMGAMLLQYQRSTRLALLHRWPSILPRGAGKSCLAASIASLSRPLPIFFGAAGWSCRGAGGPHCHDLPPGWH